MVLGHLHGKRHLPGELPLASLGPAHNPGAAAAPPTHTAAKARPGTPWAREGWGQGGWGLATYVGENIIIMVNNECSMNVKMDL